MKSASNRQPKDEREQKTSTGKLIAVTIVPVILGLAFHLALSQILRYGLSGQWIIVGLGVLAFSGFFAAVAVAAAVTKGWLIPTLMAVGIGGGSWLTGFHEAIALGAAIEVLAIAVLCTNIRREAAARLQFSVVKLLSFGAGTAITLLLVAVSLFSYVGFSNGATSGRLQKAIVEGSVIGLNKSLPLIVKDYLPSMTVDELIREQLPKIDTLTADLERSGFSTEAKSKFESELKQVGIEPSSVDLERLFAADATQRLAVLAEVKLKLNEAEQAAVNAARDRIAESFGVELRGDFAVEEGMRRIIQSRVNRITASYQRFIAPIFALSVFLTLKIFSDLYLWLSWLLGSVLLAIYRKTAVVKKVEEETVAVRYEVI